MKKAIFGNAFGRRARIVATLGPACDTARVLGEMLDSGMDVARLNFSHGTHLEHARRVRLLRREAARRGRPCSILLDLQGPKIRTGLLHGGAVTLEAGAAFTLTTHRETGTALRVSVDWKGLPRDVRRGERILLDDGQLELRVERVRGKEVACQVVIGGILSEHKGVNLPGVPVSRPSLTAKDRRDLAYGLSMGVDYVALSFVRRAADIRSLRRALGPRHQIMPVIAKLEKPQAIEHLHEILDEADGAMVARGDLGVELPAQDVPLLQKRIIEEASSRDTLVITATQMLESMVRSARPTRAEVSDVANAILDGTDAVMLSGETSTGMFPVQAVRMMNDIAVAAESGPLSRVPLPATGARSRSATHSVALAACAAAVGAGARAILVYTLSGSTATFLSKRRPAVPILVLTPREDTWRRMALLWGVTPLMCSFGTSTDGMLLHGERAVLRAGLLGKGDRVVVVSGSVHLRAGSDMMKIAELRG